MNQDNDTASKQEASAYAGNVARAHWDNLAKPLGSLGLLEEDIIQIAALRGNADVRLAKRTLLVLCADHGVTAQGVSQSDHSVTTAVAAALGRGDSTVNHLAKTADCRVVPVDVGMCDDTPQGVMNRKIMRGTDDMTKGPAMTREACEQAIRCGMDLAKAEAESGTDILLVGEMGIGNTTAAATVACALLSLAAEETVSRGAGLSDEGLQKKKQAVKTALRVNEPDPDDPADVLAKVGGLELAAICGICLGGARYQIPVLLDGVITNAAALCAVRMNAAVRQALLASHVSTEAAAAKLLDVLQLKPLICAGLHLGEGSGAVLALPLLDAALAVYHSGHTFDALGIDAYKPHSARKSNDIL